MRDGCVVSSYLTGSDGVVCLERWESIYCIKDRELTSTSSALESEEATELTLVRSYARGAKDGSTCA